MLSIEKKILRNINALLKVKPAPTDTFASQSEQARAVSDWLYALTSLAQYQEILNKRPPTLTTWTSGYIDAPALRAYDPSKGETYPVITVSSNDTIIPGNLSVSGNVKIGGDLTAKDSSVSIT